MNDTFDRFIALVESSEYEEAKKLTTKTFNADLSTIKDIKISKKQKDYELSNKNKYVYVDTYEIGYYKMVAKYNFELEKTEQGWKISNFYDEITNNQDELNTLIYQNIQEALTQVGASLLCMKRGVKVNETQIGELVIALKIKAEALEKGLETAKKRLQEIETQNKQVQSSNKNLDASFIAMSASIMFSLKQITGAVQKRYR